MFELFSYGMFLCVLENAVELIADLWSRNAKQCGLLSFSASFPSYISVLLPSWKYVQSYKWVMLLLMSLERTRGSGYNNLKTFFVRVLLSWPQTALFQIFHFVNCVFCLRFFTTLTLFYALFRVFTRNSKDTNSQNRVCFSKHSMKLTNFDWFLKNVRFPAESQQWFFTIFMSSNVDFLKNFKNCWFNFNRKLRLTDFNFLKAFF